MLSKILVPLDGSELAERALSDATALSIPLFTAYSRLRKARVELEAAIRRTANDVSGP